MGQRLVRPLAAAVALACAASCAQILGDDFELADTLGSQGGASGTGGSGTGGEPQKGAGGVGGLAGQGGAGGSGGAAGNAGAGGVRLAIKQIVAGANISCALLNDGKLRCWGGGPELGYGRPGDVGDDETPAKAGAVPAGGAVDVISAGGPTCAVFVGGSVRCWGSNAFGELGYGNVSAVGDDEPPSLVGTISLSGKAVQVESGITHACAVLAGGDVQCWGQGFFGRLGYGNKRNIGDDEVPASAGPVKLGGKATRLGLGEAHGCALLEGGSVRCWGRNDQGQLGYGHKNDIGDDELPSSSSTLNLGVGAKAAQLSVGGNHACALLEGGEVRCWGANSYGQLGLGNTEPVGDLETPGDVAPVALGSAKALQVGAGLNHSCALLEGGEVRCWGGNYVGQLGYGNTTNQLVPGGAVDFGGAKAVQIAVGGAHACALFDDGSVRCWGENGNGKLGYGGVANVGDNETPASAGAVQVF